MVARWLQAWLDSCMQRWGIRQQARRITLYYLGLLGEQLSAMLPLSLLQVVVLALFFHKAAGDPGIAAAGLLSAVMGLVLFLDGLRLSIMPMAMQVGQHLPQRLPLSMVLLVAFALGVLVTYAEPAVAAIRPLAALVDPQSAPYLYFILNQQQEITVLSIGLGVGLSAVLGMLKFMYNLPLKALIAGSLLPTIAAACWMQWGNPHLQPILGVAWDCGAVTTGPVTVPILIALGVSVMKAQRQKQQALAALEDSAVNRSEGSSLEGFGIVTLASLLPILAVEVMAIITSITHPYERVLQEVSEAAKHASTQTEPLANRSPVREVVFAVRAIAPLCAALLLLLMVVLRVPLPASHFDTQHTVDEEEDDSGDSSEGGGRQKRQEQRPDGLMGPEASSSRASSDSMQLEAAEGVDSTDATSMIILPSPAAQAGAAKNTAAAAAAAARESPGLAGKAVVGPAGPCSDHQSDAAQHVDDSNAGREGANAAATSTTAWQVAQGELGSTCAAQTSWPAAAAAATTTVEGGRVGHGRCLAWLSDHAVLLWGMAMCQAGMILFNLGLTYGFTALGNLTGTWLPTSFMELAYAPGSPYYSVAGGVVLTMATVFLLGVLATNAEPALNVLGHTVESLSGGRFSKRMLVWAVSVGVAIGMDAGACKILFSVPLIYFILAKYAAASVLTLFTKEAYAAVAWDSAGVTTGPVTVPFVLAIGLAFGKAVGAPEGFGMLTVMSVAPIISVLVTSLLRKPVQQAASELMRVSSNLARYSLERFSRRTGNQTGSSPSAEAAGLWRRSTSFWSGALRNSLPRTVAPRRPALTRSCSAPQVRRQATLSDSS